MCQSVCHVRGDGKRETVIMHFVCGCEVRFMLGELLVFDGSERVMRDCGKNGCDRREAENAAT